MRLNDIAGYAEAVERETFLRNAAFVPVRETFYGIELDPLTVGHLATLQSLGSPFVCGGVPGWQDVLIFLCVMSPQSGKPYTFKRWRFLRHCRKIPIVITGNPPSFPAIDAIGKFVSEAFQDAPGGGGGSSRSYYALAAGLVGMIAREYHWSEREILDLPLKRLWQYRSEIVSQQPDAILCNPSDRITQQWLDGKAN